ncbi:MAG: short-chain dehydrogenase [Flammeovirgaceae bacterium]|jgi:3-oxoacyl-[acyl-carrier protein] reductase|nr:short-chain dehydrogenase [Flammeovirgaceae bacterium]|tara:strand:+ start:1205 stop:1996 length:792 start_codon:yes stop_codon:yes gene_type:complete
MDLSLKGMRALVCGSSQGIGKEIAIELSNEGVEVVLIARSEENLKKVLNQLSTKNNQKHHYIIANFEDDNDLNGKIKNFGETHGKNFDILINNTGGPPPGKIINAGVSDFEKYMKMHLHCNHILTKYCLNNMKDNGYGRIINIISISVKSPIDNLGVSNTVRWAVASWAKTLSNEVAEYGITVNNVLPGFTMTERLENLINNNARTQKVEPEKIEDDYKNIIPSKRFGKPEEIASLVTFLSSKKAGYINGINIPVDGGYLSNL